MRMHPILKIPMRGPAALLLAATALLPAVTAPVAAQTGVGRVAGTVVSAETGRPLGNVHVAIGEAGVSTFTGVDGRYVLRSVAPGIYALRVGSLGFAPKVVTGVAVDAGSTTTQDVSLDETAIEMEELVVTAARESGSTAALTSERRRSTNMVDAIGREQISRTPDGDAAAALQRVPGLSVVGGRFAHVRGLGERYTATTLNGAPLPSPIPDRRAIPLDVIPSGLLESVVTSKSYSARHPGDWAGGMIQLRTRNFPTRGVWRVSASAGFNTSGSLSDGLGYPGGRIDFLGFDDGSRSLPAEIPSGRVGSGSFSPEELETVGESLIGAWGPSETGIPLDQSFGISFGDELLIGGRPLGFLASFTQSSSWSHREDLVERVLTAAGAAQPEVDYGGRLTTRNVSVGGLLHASYELAPAHRLTSSFLYNRLTEDESRLLEGFQIEVGSDVRNTRLQYVAQSVASAQLRGEHLFPWLDGSHLDWRGAWSRAARLEPNTRENLYEEVDGEFLWNDFLQSGSVFHQELTDDAFSGGLDFSLPLDVRGRTAYLSVGASAEARERDVRSRRFRFLPRGPDASGEVLRREPNELFTLETIGPDGFVLNEATFPTDNYGADERLFAGYLTASGPITDRLSAEVGARVESLRQEVVPVDRFGTGQASLTDVAWLTSTDLLPALNVTWEFAGDMNLRLGASRTVARPHLRELAPFSFADYVGGFLVLGNPLLERTSVSNLDLRWEWFTETGGLVAVSGFYKTFTDPIEVVVLPSSERIRSWVNADEAENYGAEIELRTNLGFLARTLESLELNANLTLVESRVRTSGPVSAFAPGTGSFEITLPATDRPLQGQSPYVVNVGLTWAEARVGTSASVLFHRYGERVDAVGTAATPDIYEEARSALDVVLEQRLPGGFEVRLTGARLLGNEAIFTQGGDLLRSWDEGRSFSLGLAWETR